jgi:hypothetical protein
MNSNVRHVKIVFRVVNFATNILKMENKDRMK